VKIGIFSTGPETDTANSSRASDFTHGHQGRGRENDGRASVRPDRRQIVAVGRDGLGRSMAVNGGQWRSMAVNGGQKRVSKSVKKECQRVSKSAKKCQRVSKSVKECQKVSKSVKECQKVSKSVTQSNI
jgi:hypothetical protein